MATLTVKNLPNQLYERLRTQAKRHRRSINSEAIVCLEQVLVSRRIDPEIFLAELDVLHRRLDLPHLPDETITRAKNEGRT